jgi:hypothetical protein
VPSPPLYPLALGSPEGEPRAGDGEGVGLGVLEIVPSTGPVKGVDEGVAAGVLGPVTPGPELQPCANTRAISSTLSSLFTRGASSANLRPLILDPAHP